MLPQQTRLEVVANNMANASTAGFKRSDVFERQVIDSADHFANMPVSVEQEDPPMGEYTDFSNGSFTFTDNKLDLAIDNQNSFFLVEDENGEQYLTRAGNFTVTEEGFITTSDGKKLMGEGGAINIATDEFLKSFSLSDTKALNLKITQQGDVSLNDVRIDGIEIIRVDNTSSLVNASSSCFMAGPDTEMETVGPDDVSIRQGWLENSNVNIIDEMVQMIELQRMFELGSKVISTNDSTLDESFRLGRVSI